LNFLSIYNVFTLLMELAMQQLSALDTSFIFNETDLAPQHIGNLAILDPSTAPGGKVRFKQIMQTVVDRGHLVPYMRQRLLEVPFDADFPYWLNEESFDPEFHIRHISLPAPGDWRQLCIQVARIYSRPLDRARPLWEMYVIEGLDNVEGIPKGCYATLTKTHHACLDGATSTDVGAAMTDLSATPDLSLIPSPGKWVVDKEPTFWELFARTNYNNLTKPFRFVDTVGKTAPQLLSAVTKLRDGLVTLPSPAPKSRFNGTVDSTRVFEGVVFDLENIKKIKNASGGTVNDVMLAICSGALRNYLLEKNELPDTSLVSLCPINTREPRKSGDNVETGNNVSSLTVPLRTDIADAKERLLAISTETRNAKELTKAIGAQTMLEFAKYTPTSLSAAGAKLAAELGLANHMAPVFNTVTTNVPGPQVPLYSNGARLISAFGLGIAQDMVGLFHSIGSYCGQAMISITSCRSMMPDPSRYAELLRQSLQELELAVLGEVLTESGVGPVATSSPAVPKTVKKSQPNSPVVKAAVPGKVVAKSKLETKPNESVNKTTTLSSKTS
jgi:diacylglycerol O-acyltransferase